MSNIPNSASPDSRAQKNALAFLDAMTSAGGFTMRAISYQTSNCINLLEMQIGTGTIGEAPASRRADEMHAFMFIQAAPTIAVARAVRAYCRRRENGMSSADSWDEFIAADVSPFLDTIPVEGNAAARQQLEMLGEADAAFVSPKPPPDHKSERPVPNS